MDKGLTLRRAAFALYLPILAALLCAVVLCVILLFHRQSAGIYAVPYGAVFYVLLRRLNALRCGEREPSLVLDIILFGVADLLLAALLLSHFS